MRYIQYIKQISDIKWCNNSVIFTLLGFASLYRSSSLSLSPAQRRRETNYLRTPPISREKHKITTNLLDGSRATGHVYKHLQEDDLTDMESIRRWNFYFLLFMLLFDPEGANLFNPLLHWGHITSSVIQRVRLTEVKLCWQKDNFRRNEFRTEKHRVQICELAYESDPRK